MNQRLLKLQLFYEIAMSIGNSLDINRMLKESINAYLRKLGFSAGAVFRLQENVSDDYYFQYLFSIPRCLDRNSAYQAALEIIPQGESKRAADAFTTSLPIISDIVDGQRFCMMELPEFGILVLLLNQHVLDDTVVQNLIPLNQKLAKACIACQNNDLLRTEIIIRKHSEKSRAQNEERLRTIIDSVQAGILIIDKETHSIVDINRQACKITEFTREELVGKTCHNLICPASAGHCPVTDMNERFENAERTIISSRREEIPVLETVTLVDLYGQEHIVASFIDLRETKQSEREREKLEKQLRQAQKMEAIGTLAGGIAHDFNNLLTPILGLSQLCLEDAQDDLALRDNLLEINNAGLRAKELIEQILTFARRSEDKLIPIQPMTVIKETVRLLRSSLPATIEIHSEIRTDSYILGSPSHIQQIVMNLCTNAAHAMSDTGGLLDIRFQETVLDATAVKNHERCAPGTYLKLSVRDTGIGIPEDIADAIFEPYFTTKEQNKGTGLGLSIVHGLVSNLGGFITFRSSPNQGTVFEVYIPRLRTSKIPHAANTDTMPTGTETILFIDDEMAIVQFGKKIFTRLGYSVTVSSNSLEALEIFKRDPYRFDLVMTDMTMPSMTGDKLASQILAVRPDIPIIVCTGFSDVVSSEMIVGLGIKALIYKPLLIDKLAQTVRRVLDQSSKASG